MKADEERQWEAFVKHAREQTVAKMSDSAFVTSIVTGGEPDIKFALETGLALLLDKPIVLLVVHGARIPPKLRAIADGIIEVDDLDTEAGAREVARQLKEFSDTLDVAG